MRAGIRWPATDVLTAELVAAAHSRGALLLVTDFDGTIAPIVAAPEQASPLEAAEAALRRLSMAAGEAGVRVRVAVISTRDSDDVARRVSLGDSAVIIGNAGLERWAAGMVAFDPEVAAWRPVLTRAAASLERELAAGRSLGARLERRHGGLVVHTRGLTRPTAEAEALDLAREVAAAEGLRVVAGKRTVELRIPVARDKADALAALLTEPGWGDAAVVAAGDDLPDLGMLALAASVAGGTGVAVADSETPSAVLDVADAAVEGPAAWSRVLAGLAAALAPG